MWRDAGEPFGARDYNALAAQVINIPGVDKDALPPLIGVSRSGFAPDLPLAAALGPEELLAAWKA